MKKLFAAACGVVCVSFFICSADEANRGEPFPREEYLMLGLSENQLKEVESGRRFTLSKSQLKEVRSVAPSFPKKIGVASPFIDQIPDSRFSLWPDQVSGIWWRRDQVAVARDSMQGMAGCREFNSSLNDSDAVLVDTAGNYWIGPRKVDREKLIKSLDKLAIRAPLGAAFEVFVLRPPVLDEIIEEAVVQAAVEDIAEMCQKRGLVYHIGG